MKAHPAQPDEAPALDLESSAPAWIATGLALLTTLASLLTAALT